MADEKPQKDDEPRYTAEELIEESRALLGCARHVAVGALHEDERKSFTVGQGKSAVGKFLKGQAVHA